MANYLLLRNNKESGPYSLDALIELGLKPYDLIWVQGKSAAWRYSSEVEELKPIAPATEEQPFDRFLKKTEEKQAPNLIEQASSQQDAPVIKPEHEKYIPKKSVYVSLPGQKPTPANEPIKEILPTTAVQPTISISENPAAAQIKYSQPLDEIKEMYVKTLQDRKQKIARKGFWIQNLKRTAALFSLVALGLIAGYFIRSGKSTEKPLAMGANAAEPQVIRTPGVSQSTDTTKEHDQKMVDSDPAPVSPEVQSAHQPTGGYVNKSRVDDKPNSFEKLPNKNAKKETFPSASDKQLNTSQGSVPPQGVDVNSSTGERNRKLRTGNEEVNLAAAEKTMEKKPVISNELYNLVSVKSNEYKKVAFGGIRDLQLTVTNDSKFILENVTVELQYIRPNELPLKTENIQFTSIGPNSTSTIRLPDSNRGIKVTFRIINIRKRGGDGSVADN